MHARTTWDTPNEDPVPPSGGPRYVIRGELGHGGMGRVLLAWDRLLDREVALKEVPATATPATVARFLAEARLTARLEHPSIIPVHDAGEDAAGTLYYVMKRVEGESLAEALAECPTLSARLAHLDRLVAVAQAVAHAHARGVLHRDLKPENVMLGARGETLLLDWGIALHLAEPRTGVAGTPGFMSPEQCRGEALDVRSDVWGLGAILHQLLTGHAPAEGPDPWAVVGHVGAVPIPPVRSRAPDAPAPLAAIADRALAFAREDRYPTADAMLADLDAWRTGLAVGAYHYRPGEAVALLVRRYRLPLGALAVGLAVAALTAGLAFARVRAERDVAEAALAASLEQQAAVADRDGDRLGALAYAAAALELEERPLARGLVMRHLGTVPYARVAQQPLAGCLRLTASTCVRADRVVARSGAWSLALPAASAAAEEAAGRLVLATPTEVWSVDVATGTVVARLEADAPDSLWLHPDDPERLAWSRERRVVTVDHGVRAERDLASLVKAAAWRGPEVAVATASGDVFLGGTGAPCREDGGLAGAEFSGDGARLVAVTFGGVLEVVSLADCKVERVGRAGVPPGGRVRAARGGEAFVGRLSDGTIRVWDRYLDEVLRLPRTPGWDASVVATDTGFEVATPDAVLRFDAVASRLSELPGPREGQALGHGPPGLWLVAAYNRAELWSWSGERRWTVPTEPPRALAWADDRAWVLAGPVIVPITADGVAEPALPAPLVRGMLADWGARAVLLPGKEEAFVLSRGGISPLSGSGPEVRPMRGGAGWLMRSAAGPWVRVATDGTLTPDEAPEDAAWVVMSPDGTHRGWIDGAGAPWIDGVQVAPANERRQWIEWLGPDRWLVVSPLGGSILDGSGREIARRELERGRVVDVVVSGAHALAFGSDRRVEGWDLDALTVAPADILAGLAADVGVHVVGSELRIGD